MRSGGGPIDRVIMNTWADSSGVAGSGPGRTAYTQQETRARLGVRATGFSESAPPFTVEVNHVGLDWSRM